MTLPIHYLIAAGFGADLAAKLYGQAKEFELEEKRAALAEKQIGRAAELGKTEEKRIEKLLTQLMGMRRRETAEARNVEAMRALMAGRAQQTAMLMSLLQAAGGGGSAAYALPKSGPPASIASLL